MYRRTGRRTTIGQKGHCRSPEYNEREKNFGKEPKTRGPNGPITCTWVQCATFFDGLANREKNKMAALAYDWLRHFRLILWLVEGIEILLPIKFLEFGSAVSEEKSKMSWPIRDQGGLFVFLIGPKNEKHKLGRGRLDLASCQVSLNSIQWFQRRSRKCLSQSEARRPSCFSDQPEKTQTW